MLNIKKTISILLIVAMTLSSSSFITLAESIDSIVSASSGFDEQTYNSRYFNNLIQEETSKNNDIETNSPTINENIENETTIKKSEVDETTTTKIEKEETLNTKESNETIDKSKKSIDTNNFEETDRVDINVNEASNSDTAKDNIVEEEIGEIITKNVETKNIESNIIATNSKIQNYNEKLNVGNSSKIATVSDIVEENIINKSTYSVISKNKNINKSTLSEIEIEEININLSTVSETYIKIATNNNIKLLEENKATVSSAGDNLFGDSVDYYILPATWYKPLLTPHVEASKIYNSLATYTNIVIKRYPDPVPNGTRYDIGDSNGLSFYIDGRVITIYAPQLKEIKLGDSVVYYDATKNKYLTFGAFGWDQWNVYPFTIWGEHGLWTGVQSILGLDLLSTGDTKDFTACFGGARALTALDLRTFDFSNCQSIEDMFHDNNALTVIEFNNPNFSKITNFSGIFMKCSLLQNVNVKNWDISNGTDFFAMFSGCSSLVELDLSTWKNNKAIRLGFDSVEGNGMFGNCTNLRSVNISGFDTSHVTNMQCMFANCQNLERIHVGDGWATTSVTTYGKMFQNCNNLVGGDGTPFNSANNYIEYARVDDIAGGHPGYLTKEMGMILSTNWFQSTAINKSQVETINFSQSPTPAPTTFDEHWVVAGSNGINVYRTNNDITIYAPRGSLFSLDGNMEGMFSGMTNLRSIRNMHIASTSNVHNTSKMFQNCENLTSIGSLIFNGKSLTNMSYMFDGCKNLTGTLDLSHINTVNVQNVEGMFRNLERVSNINLSSFNTSHVQNMKKMFSGCKNITSINLSNFNSNSLTNINGMFEGCENLSNINFGTNFSCMAVRDFSKVFKDCSSLVLLDLSNITTISARTFESLFEGCSSLMFFSFNPVNFDSTNVATASKMFKNCSSIVGVIFPNGFGENIVDASEMFYNCNSITNIDLSNFDTSKMLNMKQMFKLCTGITTMTLPDEFLANANYLDEIFSDMTSLTTINVSTYSFVKNQASTTNMFLGCTNLKGGNGTVYNVNIVDKTYARADGVEDIPGYFTIAPYNIVLNSDGGKYQNGSSTKSEKAYHNSSTNKYEIPTKTGYLFKDYYVGNNIVNEKWTYGNQVNEIKAKYSVNNYKIKYNGKGGIGSIEPQIATYDTPIKLASNSFTKDGYRFKFWTYNGNNYNANSYYSNLTSIRDGEITLEALWEAKNYTINYHSNGGSGSMAPETVTFGQDHIIRQNTFTRPGYIFVGWSLSENSKVAYGNRATIFLEEKYRERIDLYANWVNELSVYGVLELDGNGGYINGVTNFKAYYKENETINEVTKFRRGYNFNNWLDENDAPATYPIRCDFNNTLKLKANWAFNTFKVIYHSNNSTGDYIVDDVSVNNLTYNARTIASLAWSKQYHTFGGWSLDLNDNSVAYIDGANIRSNVSKTIHLYAIWQGNEYTITLYDWDKNATGQARNKIKTFRYGENKNIDTIKNLTYIDAINNNVECIFSGWAKITDQNRVIYFDSQNADTIYEAETGSSSISLYSVYVVKSTAVYMIFDGNGGLINGQNKLIVPLSTNSYIPYPNGRVIHRKGYNLNGWLDSDKTTPYAMPAKVNWMGSKTIYADWTNVGLQYTIRYVSYEKDTTSPTMSQETKGTLEVFNLAPNIYTRLGYRFLGWDTNEDANKVVYTDGQSVSKLGDANDIVYLYAVWTDREYVLRFYDYNNQYVGETSLYYTGTATLNPNMNIPIGKEDVGYRYTYAGNSRILHSGQRVTKDDFEITSTSTHFDLYGQIRDTIYYLVFNANGGSFAGGTSIVKSTASYLSNIVYPTNPTRANYIFEGWTLNSANYNATVYQHNYDIVLKSKWKYNRKPTPLPSFGGRGGGGRGGGSGIIKNDDTKINFVIQTPIYENEYTWLFNGSGKREGIALNINSTVAKAMMNSADFKGAYTNMSDGHIRLGGCGVYNVQYLGKEWYFGFDSTGIMMTGFVETQSATKVLRIDTNNLSQNGDIKFVESNSSPATYYLYEADDEYRGVLWSMPITVKGVEYNFDSTGRVISNSDVNIDYSTWEYNPTENNWKYLTVYTDGFTKYHKDEIVEIEYNEKVNKYIFDTNGNLVTGYTTFKGKNYYCEESGQFIGAVTELE